MRQFDVFPNPSPRARAEIPYVVTLQSHFLSNCPTQLVAPLIIADAHSAYSEVSVQVKVMGSDFSLTLTELSSLKVSLLREAIGSLTTYEDDIRRALDRLFTGF